MKGKMPMEERKGFQEFSNQIIKAVKDRFPKETNIEIHKVLKNNSLELDSLVILEADRMMSPNFYLQYYYEEYNRGMEIEEIAQQIEELYYEVLSTEQSLELDMSYENCADKIVFRLVSGEKNTELLKNVPYIPFLDMAVIFYILVRSDEDGIGSIRISNQILKGWGKEVKELFLIARENTMRLFPRKMCSMFSVMNNVAEYGGGRRNSEYFEEISGSEKCIPREPYVITNSNGINGAAVLLYPDTLKEAGAFLENDYYLLPSSIHEWLAVPADISMEADTLHRMVWEVNASCVAKEEILSESVYYYDRNLDTIKICKCQG